MSRSEKECLIGSGGGGRRLDVDQRPRPVDSRSRSARELERQVVPFSHAATPGRSSGHNRGDRPDDQHEPDVRRVERFRRLSSMFCRRCPRRLGSDIRLSGDTVQEIAITSGTIFQIDRTARESALAVPNVYRLGYGRFKGRGFGRSLTGNRRVRALVLEGTQLVGVVAAVGELPFAPQRAPAVHVINAGKGGTHSAVEVGDSVSVIGSGFLSASGGGRQLRLLFDDRLMAGNVAVGANGSFSVRFPVERGPGELVVTAERLDGRRVTVARGTIDVLPRDRAPEPQRRR